MSPSIAICGRHYPVSFTTRTYGTNAKTTYSWGFVTIGDERVSLGDPFPGRRWPPPICARRSKPRWAHAPRNGQARLQSMGHNR